MSTFSQSRSVAATSDPSARARRILFPAFAILCVSITLLLAFTLPGKTQTYFLHLSALETLCLGSLMILKHRQEFILAFLETQIHSSQDGIIALDSQGRKMMQNQRMDEICRISEVIAVIGHHANDVNPSSAGANRGEITLENGRVFDHYSVAVVGRDGKHYGKIVMFKEVTEKRLLASRDVRRQRLESIGSLASGIVHDLNNSLAPILMGTETLRLSCSDHEQRMLSLIRDCAQRASDMVNQILAFARGKEYARELIPVEGLLAEIVGLVRLTFPSAIQVQTKVSADVWSLPGNRTQLHQALLNLCVNARDAMPDGGVLTITVSGAGSGDIPAWVKSGEAGGPFLVFTVSDTGCGMTNEIQARIFDPFFTTKTPEKGTGLGLSTVQAIVKSHGGFITVQSRVGNGTEFKVYLPTGENTTASVSEAPQVPATCK
ncbi:MAG: sensor hybrid histidine kinase [Verrucomicrobiales bacterium]|nr:sensor hybrid histidine kinase [Verrucomicrobiales bacterium]